MTSGSITPSFLCTDFSICRGREAVVAAGLAAGKYVVAPDLRGHGDSDRVAPAATTLWITLPTLKTSSRRSVGLCISSGHSMGGSVSAYFTGVYPQRIFKARSARKAWDP